MRRVIVFLISHGITLMIGFALGVYFLPILTAPSSPAAAALRQQAMNATYTGQFTKELKGSDFLHWGEGTISLSQSRIVHEGALAPGPDYKLYLAPDFVEDEAGFLVIKDQSVLIGDIKSFDGAILDMPEGVRLADYTTIVVWCESFSEFITAASYR